LALDAHEARRARGALEDVGCGVRAVVDGLRDTDDDSVIATVADAVLTALP
jgi:hypothetical protein